MASALSHSINNPLVFEYIKFTMKYQLTTTHVIACLRQSGDPDKVGSGDLLAMEWIK